MDEVWQTVGHFIVAMVTYCKTIKFGGYFSLAYWWLKDRVLKYKYANFLNIMHSLIEA